MEKQLFCKKCGGPRSKKSTHESLCQKCINSLPQCYNCGIICGAKDWGYEGEKEAIPCILKKNGKEIFFCGSCKEKIVKTGELGPDIHGKILLEDIEIPSQVSNQ